MHNTDIKGMLVSNSQGALGRMMLPAKDIHILTPETCDYVTLHGKEDFTGMIKYASRPGSQPGWFCPPGDIW